MITIAIKTDNAAFTEGEYPNTTRANEIARILHELADRLMKGYALPENLRDVYGNHVGNVVVTGKDRQL